MSERNLIKQNFLSNITIELTYMIPFSRLREKVSQRDG